MMGKVAILMAMEMGAFVQTGHALSTMNKQNEQKISK